jgi:hypothetical protein
VRDRQEARLARLHRRDRGKRHQLPGERRTQPEVREARCVAPLLGAQLQDDLVLVGLGLDLVDLPLTERVVEGIVDVAGRQAETCSSRAIDRHTRDAGPEDQIVRHVGEFR